MLNEAALWTLDFLGGATAKTFKLFQSLAIARAGIYLTTEAATDANSLARRMEQLYPQALADVCADGHGFGDRVPEGLDALTLLRHNYNLPQGVAEPTTDVEKRAAANNDKYVGVALLNSFKVRSFGCFLLLRLFNCVARL